MIKGLVYDEVEKKIASVNREVSLDDFAPNSNEYYELLFNKIQELMSK